MKHPSTALRLFVFLFLSALVVEPAVRPAVLRAQEPVSEREEVLLDQLQTTVRFVTEDDFPPFNYRDEDGSLTGFNVDIAQAICLELDVVCDITHRPWDELLSAVNDGEADAAIASIAISPAVLELADFTRPYYFTPARFAARRSQPVDEVTPIGLEGRRVGVVGGTAHAQYVRTFFRDCVVEEFSNDREAREALMAGKIDYLFGDGIALAFWLNGTLSKSCCEFRGGAFAEPRYFGDGVSIAVRKGDTKLRTLLNRGIELVRESGRYEELFLRYFPFKIY